MSSHYIIKDPASPMGYIPIPEEDYIQAILSIAKKQGVTITEKMIHQEIKEKKTKETDAWDANKRKKLLQVLEKVKGIWADDKDFNKRQKEREKIDLEEIKSMKKAW